MRKNKTKNNENMKRDVLIVLGVVLVVMALSFFALTVRHKEKSAAAMNGYLNKVKQARLFPLSKENDAQYKMPKRKEGSSIQKENIYPLSQENDYKEKAAKDNIQKYSSKDLFQRIRIGDTSDAVEHRTSNFNGRWRKIPELTLYSCSEIYKGVGPIEIILHGCTHLRGCFGVNYHPKENYGYYCLNTDLVFFVKNPYFEVSHIYMA